MSSNPEIALVKNGDQTFDAFPECVEMLERLLAKAKAGDIKTIAFATLGPDGYCASGWSTLHQGGSVFQLSGSVSYLQHRLNDYIHESPDE